jgi:hypothetical protein
MWLPTFGSQCAANSQNARKGVCVAERQQAIERRQHERVPLAIPVFVRGADSEGREFLEFATALNISANGALLATRRYLPKFSSLWLEIPTAVLPPVFPKAVRRLRARPLRVTVLEGKQLWGLKFVTKLPSAKGKREKVRSIR